MRLAAPEQLMWLRSYGTQNPTCHLNEIANTCYIL